MNKKKVTDSIVRKRTSSALHNAPPVVFDLTIVSKN